MTPKEKAKELVNRFYLERSKDDLPLTIYWTSAIGCALIAVDEIIKAHLHNEGVRHLKWWEEVKQEIEKL